MKNYFSLNLLIPVYMQNQLLNAHGFWVSVLYIDLLMVGFFITSSKSFFLKLNLVNSPVDSW